MTTIPQLCDANKLHEFEVQLARGQFPIRRLYLTPLFVQWLEETIKPMPPAYPGGPSDFDQIDLRMHQFVRGEPFHFRQQIGEINCHVEYIWELKTRFYRIFGAFPEVDCFIAHMGMDADVTHKLPGLYAIAASECVEFFNGLGLPASSFVNGKDPRYVISNVHYPPSA